MNRNEYGDMALKDAHRIIQSARGSDDIRTQIANVERKAVGEQGLKRYYYTRIADILRTHLQNQTPVIIDQRQGEDRGGYGDELSNRWRRTRGMYQIWNRTRQDSGASLAKPIIGMAVAAVVLGGIVHLPLFATLLGIGIVGRWIAERENLPQSAGFWIGIMPPALTLLGGMWWVLALAFIGHYWVWPRPAATQIPEGANRADQGPPHEA